MTKYHVICQVGQGGSGKTVLCSSKGGAIFAVKLFLPQKSTQYIESDRQREDGEFLDLTKKVAKEEHERWLKLEPQYKHFCHHITLNRLQAITMPFFPPVLFNKRETALAHIKKKLEKLAEKEKLYYDTSDLRWRHFGCRYTDKGEMDITLLDLGSLSNLGSLNKTETEKIIEDQLTELKERMKSEETSEAKAVIV